MAQIKHPSSDAAITPQTDRGPHPRGTDAGNPERQNQPKQTPSGLATERQGFGKHHDSADVPTGPDDLDRNPSIGSSKGSRSGGDSQGDVEDEGGPS